MDPKTINKTAGSLDNFSTSLRLAGTSLKDISGFEKASEGLLKASSALGAFGGAITFVGSIAGVPTNTEIVCNAIKKVSAKVDGLKDDLDSSVNKIIDSQERVAVNTQLSEVRANIETGISRLNDYTAALQTGSKTDIINKRDSLLADETLLNTLSSSSQQIVDLSAVDSGNSLFNSVYNATYGDLTSINQAQRTLMQLLLQANLVTAVIEKQKAKNEQEANKPNDPEYWDKTVKTANATSGAKYLKWTQTVKANGDIYIKRCKDKWSENMDDLLSKKVFKNIDPDHQAAAYDIRVSLGKQFFWKQWWVMVYKSAAGKAKGQFKYYDDADASSGLKAGYGDVLITYMDADQKDIYGDWDSLTDLPELYGTGSTTKKKWYVSQNDFSDELVVPSPGSLIVTASYPLHSSVSIPDDKVKIVRRTKFTLIMTGVKDQSNIINGLIGIGTDHKPYGVHDGEDWNSVFSKKTLFIDLAKRTDGSLLGVGIYGNLYSMNADGTNVQFIENSGPAVIGITVLKDNTVLGIAKDNSLLIQKGSKWETALGGGQVKSITAIGNSVIGVGLNNKLYEKDDLNKPWVKQGINITNDVIGITGSSIENLVGLGIDNKPKKLSVEKKQWVNLTLIENDDRKYISLVNI